MGRGTTRRSNRNRNQSDRPSAFFIATLALGLLILVCVAIFFMPR